MSKHTPGPWRIDSVGPSGGFVPIGGCGCCDSPWVNGDSIDTELANTRLIVAAPELLEACKQALLYLSDIGGDNEVVVYEMVEAAIMKAESGVVNAH